MTTQYSPILKLALPVQGELSGTWGDVVNDNITSMVEQAIAGRAVINTWTTNSHTLTTANGVTSESRCAMLELTDTGTALSAAGTVICPAASKIYIVKNAAGQNITVKTSSGTGILVPDGRTTFLFCDGTNVVEAMTHTTSLQLGTSTTVTAVLDEDNMASDSATSLATQQSIKAYVDAQVGANNELSEVLANGNTTGGTDIAVSAGDDITFTDSSKAIFGAGSDLQIYHDGGNSLIEEAGVGNLIIRGSGNVDIQPSGGGAYMARFAASGAATLYNNGAAKLATTSTGVAITGNATFADNGKAIFGAGSDLQIYHESSTGNSRIIEGGAGNLNIEGANLNLKTPSGENYINCNENAGVILRYNNEQKLATSSTGVDVTGTVTSDALTVDGTLGNFSINTGGNQATFDYNGFNYINTSGTGAALVFRMGDTNDAALRLNANGDILFYEDTGTTAKLTWDASNEALEFAEGAKAKFGAGSDLQIYHNGTNSIVQDVGAGSLSLQSNGAEVAVWDAVNSQHMAQFQTGGAVSLRHNGDIKIATASTGADVTGTITSDGLTVATATGSASPTPSAVSIGTTSNASDWSTTNPWGRLTFNSSDVSSSGPKDLVALDATAANTSGGVADFTVKTWSGSLLDRLKVSWDGDISFYEDTGTTAKFFWDAAAESLGVGTSSPGRTLDVQTTSGDADVRIYAQGTTSADDAILYLGGAGTTATNRINFGDADDADRGRIIYGHSGDYMSFTTAAEEAMRLDLNGNLLVGTQNSAPATNNVDGISLRSEGHINVSRSSGVVGYFNRRGGDGSILEFRRGTTPVGSIGATSGNLDLDSGSTGRVNVDGVIRVIGTKHSGVSRVDPVIDTGVDLGAIANRFKDLHLSGTVNANSVDLGSFVVTETNGHLYFSVGGVNKMKLDSSGNLQVVGNVESNATIT